MSKIEGVLQAKRNDRQATLELTEEVRWPFICLRVFSPRCSFVGKEDLELKKSRGDSITSALC